MIIDSLKTIDRAELEARALEAFQSGKTLEEAIAEIGFVYKSERGAEILNFKYEEEKSEKAIADLLQKKSDRLQVYPQLVEQEKSLASEIELAAKIGIEEEIALLKSEINAITIKIMKLNTHRNENSEENKRTA